MKVKNSENLSLTFINFLSSCRFDEFIFTYWANIEFYPVQILIDNKMMKHNIFLVATLNSWSEGRESLEVDFRFSHRGKQSTLHAWIEWITVFNLKHKYVNLFYHFKNHKQNNCSGEKTQFLFPHGVTINIFS